MWKFYTALGELKMVQDVSAHPDLSTHDALGLATDAELTAHVGDTTSAHKASAIEFEDDFGLAADSATVEDAIGEIAEGKFLQWMHDGGASNSSTPGTLICEIEAPSGYELIAWQVTAGVVAALANRMARIVITYTDATTFSTDTTTNSNEVIHIHGGGGFMIDGTGMTAAPIPDQTKKIQKLRVQTLGSAAGNRHGRVSGIAVPVV